MTEGDIPVAENASLTLGFLGNEDVHRLTAKELLDDFIEAFRKNHRKAVVRFLVSVDPFTPTMSFLADHALTSGYQLGLIGSERAFKLYSDDLKSFIEPAQGLTVRLTPTADLAKSMVSMLAVYDEARLILLSDPTSEEDELGYQAADYADKKNIPCRSLLHGLDRVRMEEDEEEEQPVGRDNLHLVHGEAVDDDEFEEDEVIDDFVDDDDDEIEGSLDEDGFFDPGDDEVESEIEDEADEEPEDDEVEDAEVVEDDLMEPGEESEEQVEEQEPMAARKWSQEELEGLGKEELYEAAAKYGILPGRGIKQSMMISRILEAEGTAPAEKPAKKAPAKKAAKKAPAAKKTAPVAAKKPAAKAPAATNGHVSKAQARTFIELAQASLDIAKSLV